MLVNPFEQDGTLDSGNILHIVNIYKKLLPWLSDLEIWASKIYGLEANIKILSGRNFFVYEDIDGVLTLFFLKFNFFKNVFVTIMLEYLFKVKIWL